MENVVVLPGIGGSGDAHWQSLWERRRPQLRRFQPASWDRPTLDDWVSALDRAVASSHAPPILVAHSLACLLVAHWSAISQREIAGAFLVAVPDPQSSPFPSAAAELGGVPEGALRFPSLIVASTSDPFSTIDYARLRARQWGSRLVEVGPLGHINASSGVGEWPKGWSLLQEFLAKDVSMARRAKS
jgi:predicted alpha/beta hydrolase family esterase